MSKKHTIWILRLNLEIENNKNYPLKCHYNIDTRCLKTKYLDFKAKFENRKQQKVTLNYYACVNNEK